jgi:uncharacterized protein (DUF58 family)
VGAVVFDDHDIEVIPPLRSREQVMRILKAIMNKNLALGVGRAIHSNPAMLNEALERAARLARHDHLVCSIGDGVGADDETVRLATKITEHNDMIAVLIYDPLEADLPDAGTMVMAEEEKQLEVDTSDRRLRSRFSEDFEQRLEWIRRMSRLRAIPLLPVHTGEGAAEQVRGLLGHSMGARKF